MEKFEEKIESKKEKQPEIQPPEFEREEFEEARKNFENLTRELMPAIKEHKYNIIISDDASGRIPTLVIGRLLKEIYEGDKVTPPKILFLAGGRHGWQQGYQREVEKEMVDYFQKLIDKRKIDPRDRILLTTEYMGSGKSISRLAGILKKTGLPYDIATLSYYMPEDEYLHNIKELRGSKIYSSGIIRDRDAVSFYNLKPIAGVIKVGDKMFSLPARMDMWRDTTLAARRDVKKMVDYLKQIYDREKEKIEK